MLTHDRRKSIHSNRSPEWLRWPKNVWNISIAYKLGWFLSTFRLPSLEPHRKFHMNRYSINNQVYTKIYQGINRPFVELSSNYKAQKLDFWNKQIPFYSGGSLVSIDVTSSPVHETYVVTGPDHWALIATSIGLAGLVLFLAVGYCRTKIQLQNMHVNTAFV